MAARTLGFVGVPVIELGHLTEAQKRAYILADNRLAKQAGWDLALLAIEEGELADLGIDLASLGFEVGEIDALLRAGEAVSRENVVPVSRPGDLWVLGKHRLICGDATVAAIVEQILDGVSLHLMVTKCLTA